MNLASCFLKSNRQNIAGEPGEDWVSDIVVLVLKYGDSTLHDYLLGADSQTRISVCRLMASMLKPEDIKRYPKTMSLDHSKVL